MEAEEATRVLVVANRTAATPALIEAVRERAAQGRAAFTLLVPALRHGLHQLVDPEDQASTEAEDAVIELAVPLLEEAAGAPVQSLVGAPEPLAAVEDAVNIHGFDEIVARRCPAGSRAGCTWTCPARWPAWACRSRR